MQWHSGSIAEAVSEAKRNNRLFLVYVEGNDAMSKSMTGTYEDPLISEKLASENVIALKLTANSVPFSQFCQIYPVLVIPSSYFIGGDGAPIEIITGSLAPAEFTVKLDNVIEIYKKFHPSPPGISSSKASTSSNQADVLSPSTSSSVASADVSQPSTSKAASETESTDVSARLEDKVERAKALIEAKRQIKAQEDQEKERNEEIARRNMGKAMQQAQLSKKEIEMKEWAQNRAKEKEEERLAREKVKAMIAQDRAEQAAKYQKVKEAEDAERRRFQLKQEEEDRANREAAMNYNDARLQFRLPNGSHSTHCFSAEDTLEDARRFVREEVCPPFRNFSLCTTFPRRHFTEADYPETLRNLQLAPSAVLLILPASAVSSVNQSPSFFSSMLWFVLSPVTSVWNMWVYGVNFLRSFIFGSPSTPQPPTESSPEVPSTQANTNKSTKMPSNNKTSGIRRRESPFAKREGNIFRINNQSDDDENNTWNGNSTQQM